MAARRTLSSLRAAVAGLVSSLTRPRTGNAARAEAGGVVTDDAPGDCWPFGLLHSDHAVTDTPAAPRASPGKTAGFTAPRWRA
jgi:hypothetical protein